MRHLENFVVSARPNDRPAAFSRPRPQVENAVGRAHDIRIVLDHKNRISQIAQIMQNFNKPVRIAAVQANRRLIEHIQRPDQTRPQRSRELNPLRLAARQGRSQPVQRQIFQPDVVEKAQPFAKFDQQLLGNRRLLHQERDPREKRAASSTVMLHTWQMFLPSILTCRASTRRRVPPHSEHCEYPR